MKSSSESADGKFVNDFAYAKKKGRGVDRKVCKKFSPFCWKVRLFWFFSNLFRGISFYRFMHLHDLPLPPLPPSQILWRSRAWLHSSALCPFVDKRWIKVFGAVFGLVSLRWVQQHKSDVPHIPQLSSLAFLPFSHRFCSRGQQQREHPS